jgi:hypothetical protein
MKKSLLFVVLIALAATSQSLFAGVSFGPPIASPDGGSTAMMLSAGIGCVMWARSRFSR